MGENTGEASSLAKMLELDGASMTTIGASAGASAGAKPTNDATYLKGGCSYGGLRAVPVFPATRYPAIAAFAPVPVGDTTCSSMPVISAAVASDTTRRVGTRGTGCSVPSL